MSTPTATSVVFRLVQLSSMLDEATAEYAHLDEEWVKAKAAHQVGYARAFHAEHPGAVLVHGDAPKGDRTAAGIWKSLGGEVEAWPADWKTYGKRAGKFRNFLMVETNPDLVLSFIRGNSAGATHCTDLAEGAGLPVVRYTQEGE